MLCIFADLIVVVSGERFDRKYFAGVVDVATDVPAVEVEVVRLFINVRVEKVAAAVDTGDVQHPSRNRIVVNLSESGKSVATGVAPTGSCEAVQLTHEQVRAYAVVIETVVEHEAQVVRVVLDSAQIVLSAVALAAGEAHDNRTGFGIHFSGVELTRSVLADALLDIGYEFVIIIAIVQVVSALRNMSPNNIYKYINRNLVNSNGVTNYTGALIKESPKYFRHS